MRLWAWARTVVKRWIRQRSAGQRGRARSCWWLAARCKLLLLVASCQLQNQPCSARTRRCCHCCLPVQERLDKKMSDLVTSVAKMEVPANRCVHVVCGAVWRGDEMEEEGSWN